MKTIILKYFLKNIILIKTIEIEIEIYSNYSYYVDSDDEKCIDLFLETIR